MFLNHMLKAIFHLLPNDGILFRSGDICQSLQYLIIYIYFLFVEHFVSYLKRNYVFDSHRLTFSLTSVTCLII